jgi:hypothetical protein
VRCCAHSPRDGIPSRFALGSTASPHGHTTTYTARGTILVSEHHGGRVRAIAPDGVVSTVTGSAADGDHSAKHGGEHPPPQQRSAAAAAAPGAPDGPTTRASFAWPRRVALEPSGRALLVAAADGLRWDVAVTRSGETAQILT